MYLFPVDEQEADVTSTIDAFDDAARLEAGRDNQHCAAQRAHADGSLFKHGGPLEGGYPALATVAP
jgi:hypothetical protein